MTSVPEEGSQRLGLLFTLGRGWLPNRDSAAAATCSSLRRDTRCRCRCGRTRPRWPPPTAHRAPGRPTVASAARHGRASTSSQSSECPLSLKNARAPGRRSALNQRTDGAAEPRFDRRDPLLGAAAVITRVGPEVPRSHADRAPSLGHTVRRSAVICQSRSLIAVTFNVRAGIAAHVRWTRRLRPARDSVPRAGAAGVAPARRWTSPPASRR
jgi:hypothetical protein